MLQGGMGIAIDRGFAALLRFECSHSHTNEKRGPAWGAAKDREAAMTLHRPESLEDALALLAGDAPRVLAGGTDLYPALQDGPAPAALLDITRIKGLCGITRMDDGWRIGATTRWSDICAADLPPCFDGLKQAGAEVGSIQIQNAGTIAGNICNASPAADGVPPLLVLDAIVELAGAGGVRHLPLADFILGPRRTALRDAEIVTALMVPDRAGQGAFLKLGARRYLVISMAMVAARVAMDGGKIADLAVAVGACGPVAARLPELEAVLTGCALADVADIVEGIPLPQIAPIDDVRASATYREEAACGLIVRAITQAAQASEQSHVA